MKTTLNAPKLKKHISYEDQVGEVIREKVISGEFAAGEKIPSSREIAASLDTNSFTVLKALRDLQSEGLLISYPRRGIFVQQREEKLTCVGVYNGTSAKEGPYAHAVQEALTDELQKLSLIHISTDANGEANGINLFNTTINAGGGDISLTGTAGYANPGGGIDGGLGVGIGSDGTTVATLSTTGTGNITITGIFNQAITSHAYFAAVDIYQDGSGSNVNNLSVANGTISITGTVSQGMAAGTGNNAASIGGVEIGTGSFLSLIHI